MDFDVDAQLMQRFVRGDAGAFDALHGRNHARVVGALRRAGLDEAEADDLAQDVFVRVFRSARQYDPTRSRFTTWLGAIARNCLARHFSAAGRADQADWAGLIETLPAREDNPAALVVSAEVIAGVDDCISQLPLPLRRIVEMRYVQALTTRSIAQGASISEASVRNRLTEAKGLLTKCLGKKDVL